MSLESHSPASHHRAQGAPAPTPTELAVIRALAHGQSRKELARARAICYATLSRHLYNIQLKLGAQSAEQMVYLAVKRGLID